MTRPAVFLDRDGVINENRSDHVKSWAEFVFLPGSLDALRRLALTSLPIVVVSNQAIIGRGLVPAGEVDAIHRRMVEEVRCAGGRIDAVLYCPHRPEDRCACRKPMPGMLYQAAQQHNLDLSRSFMVGDAWADMAAARSAGCTPIMVRTGRGEAQLAQPQHELARGLRVVDDLPAAVAWICQATGQPGGLAAPSWQQPDLENVVSAL